MRAFYERRVERNDVEQGPKPELSPQELPSHRGGGDANGRVEEELDRLVAGLAMDLDRAREIRCAAVVEPVVVREPRARLRDDDEVAGALVVDADRGLLGWPEHALDARRRLERRSDLGEARAIVHVHVCDL